MNQQRTTPTSTRAERTPEVQRLRDEIAWRLWMRRSALRTARRHEVKAANGASHNPDAALDVAAAYRRDADRDAFHAKQLRNRLADLSP